MGIENDPWCQDLQAHEVADALLSSRQVPRRLNATVYVVILSDAAHQQTAGLLAVQLMNYASYLSVWVAPAQPQNTLTPRVQL